MRYLGSVTRDGSLMPDGEAAIPASFELECYALKGGLVHGSGEITATPKAMRLLQNGASVDFLTIDGHLLNLKLADKKTPPEGGAAYVLATGDLPAVRDGSLGWAPAA